MGYVKPPQVDTLKLPSDPTYTVVMKRRASYGDLEEANSAMLQVDAGISASQPKVEAKVQWGAYVKSLLLSMIVSWNLTDENDAPLPVTAASLSKLDPSDGQFLSREAELRSRPREEAKEVPFVTPSSGS